MARTTPNSPQPYRAGSAALDNDFHVDEVAAEHVGAMAPWGDVEFPLPVVKLSYRHPGPADRPHLAGD